jgi:ACS family hexuronate transporter-like MFS transporter
VFGTKENWLSRAGASTPYLLLMTLGYTVYAADRTVLSSVLVPLSGSLSLSNSQIGLLGSAQYIGVLCTVFIAGHLSDKYGRRSVLLSGVVVFTSFTWLIGLSQNFSEAFVFRLISGLGEGMFWPVAMSSVANLFKARKGLALGIFYVGFDAGSVAGLSIGGLAYYLTSDWRPAFFIAPSLGLTVIAGLLFTRGKLGEANDGVHGLRLGRDALQLVRRRNVILIMTFALLATWSSVWQAVFLPYYFLKVLHFPVLSAALLSSIVAVAGGFGKIILGGLSDRVRRNRLLAATSLALLSAYALFFASSNFLLDLVGAISMGFFSASLFPVMQALMTDSCHNKTGTALGLSTSAQSIATVFSTYITASLFTIGIGRAVAIDAMVPTALALAVALLLREVGTQRQHVKMRTPE